MAPTETSNPPINVLEVKKFEGGIPGGWGRISEKIENQDWTARVASKDGTTKILVHLIVSDPLSKVLRGDESICGNLWGTFSNCTKLGRLTLPFVGDVGHRAFLSCTSLIEADLAATRRVDRYAFAGCENLSRISIPLVTKVEHYAFGFCSSLRRISLRPDANVSEFAFVQCLTLEILATASNFSIDTGDKWGGQNNPTVGITRFLKWRNQMDVNKEVFKITMSLLELCNRRDETGSVRASTEDPWLGFLAGPARDLAKHVLSFKLGEKRGKGDMERANKAKLLEVGLEMGVLNWELNWKNMEYWGVIVDAEGKSIDGGLAEAIERGLVTKENAEKFWRLQFCDHNGEFIDREGRYR